MNMQGLRTALKTLTLLQVPGKESEELSEALPWFPVVGLFLGLLLYVVSMIWGIWSPLHWPAGIALLLVVVEVWLTGGLHLDGLADWADSFGAYGEKEKMLAIMKDTRIGAFGVLALVLALMAKWIGFERLLSSGSTIWVVAIFTLSRSMMVDLITTRSYARSGGGTARAFVEGASSRHRCVSHLLSLTVCLVFGPLGFALFGLAWLMTRLFGMYCQRWFGGITGDLLGAENEIVGTSLLIVCAFAGESLVRYTGWRWIL